MAASKELITKIVLRAQADSSISKAFSALSKNSDTCIGKLTKIGDTATKAFKYVASAAAAGAFACGKAAIDFESAFAGVQKTVDETDTTSYEDLSNGIRNLAKETPAAATEIAEVAAAAGQLGIKADDVLSFSKVMIDLGESTNLTSDEAATSIAKLFNVTGTSMSQVSNFGSTLVALGNNAATTESDILAMGSRIAASGSQIGLTEQQILALATSLSSVGLEAEAGGTAISTTMSQIDKAVGTNSEELAIWAKTAGMSTSAFSKMWKTDAYGALQKVMQGMATTKDEGGNLNLLLEELGINGIRQGDSLKRLANATGLMTEMTDLANKSWSENAALSKEANTRYATTASRIQILKNKITDVMITIGNALLPVINKLIDKMDDVNWDAVAGKIVSKVQWVIDNFDKVKVALGILAGAFAAFKIGGFITTISGAVKEVKTLYSVLEKAGKFEGLSKIFATFKSGGFIAGIKAIGTSISGAFSGAAAAIGVSSGVLLAIIAVIALVVGAFVTLWKTNDKFRGKITEIWSQIKGTISGFCDGIVERINSLGFNFSSITEVISAIWKQFCNLLAPIFVGVFQHIQIILSTTLDTILGIVDFFIALFSGDWQGCWTAIQNIFSTIWSGLVSWFKNILNTLKGVADVVLGWFGTSWSECWSKIKEFFVNTWSNIKSFFTNTTSSIKTGFSNFINNVVNWFAQLPSRIWSFITNVANSIATWGVNLWNKAKEIGANFVNGIVNFFKKLPYYIGFCIGFVIGKIILFGQKLWNFATVTVPQFIGKVVDWFKQLPSKIWTWLMNTAVKIGQWGTNVYNKMKSAASKAINATVNFFKTLPSKVWNWLVNTATKIGQWGSNILAKMRSAASNAINAVVNFFKQLPGKVWTWLSNTISKIVSWGSQMIAKARKFASDTVNAIVNFFKQLPNKMLTIGKNVVQGIWNGMKNAKDWLIGKIKQFAKGITDGIKKALGINSPSVVMEKLFKWVPIGAGNGIINNAKYAVNAIKSMGGKITSAASKINPTISSSIGLQKFGTGGTVTSPQAAIVGDRPETIVPHGNTTRNRALLAEAARGVGATGGNVFQFTFAPVINGGNAAENRAMIQDEEEKFERQMMAFIEKNRRLAFNV